jgi:hypothetical protein
LLKGGHGGGPKFPHGADFQNPYVALQNEMEHQIFLLQWEREHFRRPLGSRQRKALDTILASIEHLQGQLGLTWLGMAVALQARLSNEAKPASPPQSRPVTANKCTRAAAAESALDGWGDSSVLSMWKRGKNVKQLIGTIELSEANEGELDGWIEGLQRLEVVECDRGEDPFHREDVNSSCLTHLIHPSTDGTFCKMILLLKDANQQQKI